MGNQNSTVPANDTHPGQHSNDSNNPRESSEAQDPELRSMRRSLREDQESFILNNLMLCVQFFENYQRELQDIRSRPTSQREDDMNEILSRSRKHTLLPGILEEQVSNHVNFSSEKTIDNDSTIEPIQPVHMYVVLDNIVLDNVHVDKIPEIPNESTSADSIFYKMHLEPSTNHGYVRLRLLGETPAPRERVLESSESDLPHIAEGDDEIYSKQEDTSNLTKPNYAQSMTDLCNIDRNGETALLRTDMRISQTNLVHSEHPDDEGYQELTYSGLPEPRSGRSSKQSKQFGTRLQSMQPQQRRSLESIPRSSKSSGYKSESWGSSSVIYSESDYGCTASTSSVTSKSSTKQIELPISSSKIPISCFTKKVQPRNLREKRTRNGKLCRNEKHHSYLRSHKFRRYFKELFVERLAKRLGFENEDDTDVTRRGAVIHCFSMKISDGNPTLVIPHEIVPSISSEWPESCSEWLQRSTNAVFNFPNRDTWLTKERIKKVKKLGCHVIPVSCLATGATNPSGNVAVEWQLTFPAAERYLETCLSHSQAKVYMMALLLNKTFIRSADPGFGLTNSHIRHQLFWLLEQNYPPPMWAEDRGGESLKVLLKKLYSGVTRSEPRLADYFISNKNLFANIPMEYLNTIHYQIKLIIENPVLYLITAMKKIRYKPDFFPVMNYKRLYKLLTVDEADLLALISPELIPQPQKEERLGDKVKTKKNPVFDRLQEIENYKNSVNKLKNTPHGLATRILDQCAELHGLRLIAVLSMFIEHFTKMAKSCYYYGAMDQKDVYLNQAYRLSMILKKQTNGKEDAETYLDSINTLRRELSRLATQEGVPGTSAQSDLPTFSIPFNQLYVDQSNQQGIRLYGPHTSETNEFDIHPASLQIPLNVNSQQTTNL